MNRVGKYSSELARLKSYVNWPPNFPSPATMAASGLYYEPEREVVRCFECLIEIEIKKEGTNPILDHQFVQRKCRFLTNIPCGNKPIIRASNMGSPLPSPDFQPENLQSTKCKRAVVYIEPMPQILHSRTNNLVITTKKIKSGPFPPWTPVHKELTEYTRRLATFSTWTAGLGPRKEEMAAAGFFLINGQTNNLRCHHCDRCWDKWKPTDNPWVRHAQGYSCYFVWRIQGLEFMRKFGQAISKSQKIIKRSNQMKIRPTKGTESTRTLSSESSTKKIGKVCRICGCRKIKTTYWPCGHTISCLKCSKHSSQCLACGQSILRIISTFLY